MPVGTASRDLGDPGAGNRVEEPGGRRRQRIQPPFGGEIAAQVTVLTPIGTVKVTGSASHPSRLARVG